MTWIQIPGYEGKYEVSDEGCVRHGDRMLKVIQSGNYRFVYLTKDGVCRQVNLLNILDSCFDSHIFSQKLPNNPEEIWRSISGFEGHYSVSSQGRVRSESRVRRGKNNSISIVRERIRVACDDEDGYLILTLYDHSVECTRSVHRLVAEAFIPNPENKPQVNHKDGNKHNNNVDNLEWCDNLYNIQHSVSIGLRNYADISKTTRPAYHIEDIHSHVYYASASALARELKCSSETVTRYIKRSKTNIFKLANREFRVIS